MKTDQKKWTLRQCITLSFILCLCFVFVFSAPSVFADEFTDYEDFGWVEVKINVPEGFTEPVVVIVNNTDLREDFAALVTAEDKYVTVFQVPVGNYEFGSAFLENGEQRYITKLVSEDTEFFVSGNEEDLVKLVLETTPDPEQVENTEPSGEAQGTEPSGTTAPTSPTGGDESSDTSDPSDGETTPTDPDSEAEPPADDDSMPLGKRLLMSFLSTVVFGVVVFGGAYLYRKHVNS